ncbi:MAG: hemerythrin domain-containing protein [Actinomycetota bacterium]|nr:hemerythrin domain-containing protein [Actinomycetota bacterium]
MSVSTSESSTDVIEFLLAQHQEVRQLFAQVQTGGGEARREPFECLVRLLAVHETAEEEVVYPALRSTGPDGERIADERTAEEDEAKKVLSDLERIGPTDEEHFDAKLEAFRLLVIDHAESEEREVFPRLRASLDADKLRSMRSAVEAAERMAPTHPHPHAPESAVGNMLTGPFVAMADKVRDAIRGPKSG